MNDLLDIPNESKVFVDSNIITYFLLKQEKHYSKSKYFLKNIEKGTIFGFIDSIVISETYFNYIKILLSDKFTLPLSEVIPTIKINPEILEEIDIEPVDKILNLDNLKILTINNQDYINKFILKYHLLPNDAIHATCCKIHGITDIATNDADFIRVDFLNIWKP